jgi:serine/threonine protein kinase
MELTSAVAWLETLGLVHGNLRPPNILLDNKDHLKLADFDCVDKIRSASKGNAPP